MSIATTKTPLENWAELNGALASAESLLFSVPADSTSWEAVIRELSELRSLEDDWDGLGAKAPSERTIQSAILLAGQLSDANAVAPFRVVPGVNGTIILEWQHAKTYFEIEVTGPFLADCTKLIPGLPPEHWQFHA